MCNLLQCYKRFKAQVSYIDDDSTDIPGITLKHEFDEICGSLWEMEWVYNGMAFCSLKYDLSNRDN